MPDNALIPADMIVQVGSEDAIKELTKASNFIPSIRVFDGSSKPAKSGKIPTGDIAIALGSDNFLALGKEVSVLNLGYRPRASIFQGEAKPIDYFDADSEDFKQVHESAMAGKKGYQSGLEYLVYVPQTQHFCCFYLGNKSGRYVSDDMKALVGKGATIRSKFVERPENSWWCAEILPCTTPFDLPEKEATKAAIELFTKTSQEKADDTADEETGRER